MGKPGLGLWSLAALALVCSALVQAQTPYERPAGTPGTATPQPFSVPQPRHVPNTAPSTLPLHKPGTDRGGLSPSLPSGTLAPPDGELPLLEQQLRRNSQGRKSPSKSVD